MKLLSSLLLLLCLAILPAWAQDVPPTLATGEGELRRLIAQMEPALVMIIIARSDPYEEPGQWQPGQLGVFPRTERERLAVQRNSSLALHHPDHVCQYLAAGVVIDSSGLVLTLAHPLRQARKVYVRLRDGRGSYADVHAADPRSDWAVLRLLDGSLQPVAAQLGEAEMLEKGHRILTMELPAGRKVRGLDWAAGLGMLARRSWLPATNPQAPQGLQQMGDLLVLDRRALGAAAGAGAFDLRGRLVGLIHPLHAAHAGRDPPLHLLCLDEIGRRCVDALRLGQEVEYGFLGVSTEPATVAGKDLDNEAVRISQDVLEGTPAGQAQLRRGDYLFAVRGTRCRNNEDFQRLLGPMMAGKEVELTVWRDRRQLQVRISYLAKAAPPDGVVATQRQNVFRGAHVDHLTTLFGQLPPERLDWQERLLQSLYQGAVVVRAVEPDSAADKAGLCPNDVLMQFNDRPVRNPRDFQREAERASGTVLWTVSSLDPQAPQRKVRLD